MRAGDDTLDQRIEFAVGAQPSAARFRRG